MICHYCQTDPGLKPDRDVVWNGFLDADLKLYVCFKCREIHYINKTRMSEVPGKVTYSELPVIINPPVQLKLKL